MRDRRASCAPPPRRRVCHRRVVSCITVRHRRAVVCATAASCHVSPCVTVAVSRRFPDEEGGGADQGARRRLLCHRASPPLCPAVSQMKEERNKERVAADAVVERNARADLKPPADFVIQVKGC